MLGGVKKMTGVFFVQRLTMILMCGVLMAGCVSSSERVVSGRLVRPGNRQPVAGQGLALDRPPGNYPSLMALFGIPQPVAIATITTDRLGRFRFVTRKDRGRYLEIRLAGKVDGDFHSRTGYKLMDLRDSLKSPPAIGFDPQLIHDGKGGFRAVP